MTRAWPTVLLLVAMSRASSGQCPFVPFSATTDPHDVNFNGLSLQFPNLHVFNYYYSTHWNDIPGNPPRELIDLATHAVIAGGYFNRACQYGTPQVFWKGSGSPGSSFFACGTPDPPGTVRLNEFLHFFMCQEGLGQVGGYALGAPHFSCVGCDISPGSDCYLDAACVASPNGTGDTIFNVFFPANVDFSAFGPALGPFHFQFPSNRIGSIPFFAGSGVPLTAGRPIYIAFIPVSTTMTFDDLMDAVTHEDIEAATDPFPAASWIHDGAPAGHGEVGDICDDFFVPNRFRFIPPPMIGGLSTAGLPAGGFDVARYWSNDGHTCGVPFITPSTMAVLVPPPNGAGWNRTSVTVLLTAMEPDGVGGLTITSSASGAEPRASSTSSAGSVSLLIASEGLTTVSFFATDGIGIHETPKQQPVRIDETLPSILEVSRSPPANPFGWNRTPVSVSFSCSDALSGVASCQSPVAISTEGAAETLSATAVDKADNVSTATATGINIDLTPPTVLYVGNAGSYTIDQIIDIQCVAADALSGVQSSTCQNIQGAAYTFFPAATFSAMATDLAGNVGTGSTTFIVRTTFASLGNLAMAFACRPGIGHSLAVKTAKAEAAADQKTRDNILFAFIHEVQAQAGKCLTQPNADLLTMFALLLM